MSKVDATDVPVAEVTESEPASLLLNKDGSIETFSAERARLLQSIDGETDTSNNVVSLSVDSLLVVFNGAADGRGFSLAKWLRESGFTGCLYAGGSINPDQVPLVFQTGFDAVLVSDSRWQEYGESSWQAALSPIVSLSYAATDSKQHRSIWQTRHST